MTGGKLRAALATTMRQLGERAIWVAVPLTLFAAFLATIAVAYR